MGKECNYKLDGARGQGREGRIAGDEAFTLTVLAVCRRVKRTPRMLGRRRSSCSFDSAADAVVSSPHASLSVVWNEEGNGGKGYIRGK